MKRRRMLIGAPAIALLVPWCAARAQPAGKVYRIGWLWISKFNVQHSVWNAFRLELQRLGWTEGRNVVFEHRGAEGVEARFYELARELVESNVDLICACGGNAAFAAKAATSTIPIVFVAAPNPALIRLVPSLARPGGNVTGVGSNSAQLIGKRLELLKEAFPHILNVGLLPFVQATLNYSTHSAALNVGLKLLTAQVQRLEDIAPAVAALAHVDAWFVQDDVLYIAYPRDVIDVLAKQRKPAIYPHTMFTEVGGLMSYSTDIAEQFRRAATYVDRILRGAKPGDLAVEEPTRLELVINMKTAKALGLTMPKSFLLRADRVIE